MSEESRKKLYSQDGVDVEEEAKFSNFAASVCRASYQNSPFVKVYDLSGGHFRGPRPFNFTNLPEGYSIEATTDGLGTKGILIDAAGAFPTAAYDLLAMTGSDITRFGGIPLVFVNALDIVAVGEENDEARKSYLSALEGLGEAAQKEKIVLLKGETAQMGPSIGSEIANSKTKINWTGTMIGAYHKDKMITGDSLAEGQVIIALRENGFRCNGISAVRAALRTKFGPQWGQEPSAKESVKAAAVPSVLYDTFLSTLHGWFDRDFKPDIKIHALVHLSGGAFREKLANDLLFGKGLSADLDNLWDPPEIMKNCAAWREMSDEEFYEVWNGGQGLLMIVDAADAEHCIQRAKDFQIEAKIAGTITKQAKPQLTITSKLSSGKKIVYG